MRLNDPARSPSSSSRSPPSLSPPLPQPGPPPSAARHRCRQIMRGIHSTASTVSASTASARLQEPEEQFSRTSTGIAIGRRICARNMRRNENGEWTRPRHTATCRVRLARQHVHPCCPAAWPARRASSFKRWSARAVLRPRRFPRRDASRALPGSGAWKTALAAKRSCVGQRTGQQRRRNRHQDADHEPNQNLSEQRPHRSKCTAPTAVLTAPAGRGSVRNRAATQERSKLMLNPPAGRMIPHPAHVLISVRRFRASSADGSHACRSSGRTASPCDCTSLHQRVARNHLLRAHQHF